MAPATAVTTQTDSNGQPTTTVTDFGGELILTTKLTTVTDTHGQPVTTVLTTAPVTSRVKTVTDASGSPIATVTSFPVYPKIPGASPANIVLANKRFSYFLVYFFPILLSLLVLVPIHIIDAEIKLLIPFRSRSQHHSIRTDGLPGRLSGWRLLLHHGDPLSVLSDLTVLCAACLVALSGETIGLKLRGTCIKQNMHTCLVTVAAFPTPARAAEALLGALMVLILMLGFYLSRKRTGVAAHPGTIAAVCALLQIPETRRVMMAGLLISPEHAREDGKNLNLGQEMLGTKLQGAEFKLGWVEEGARANDYGLVVVHALKQQQQQRQQEQSIGGPTASNMKSKPVNAAMRTGKITFRIGLAERSLQVGLLVFLCGVLTVLLYYENTRYTDITESAFEYFIDSQEFGVILLFTAIGEIIYLLWDQFFVNYTAKSIFLHMAQRPQPAALSVLRPRSTDVFTALYRGLRTGDPLASSIAFAGVLSKATPALLAGIPFQAAQTFKVHEICTWSAVATLATMILVLVAHMWLVKWPDLAAAGACSDGACTLAVAAYYVCDSYMLRDFERLSLLGRVERDRRVEGMRRLYRFGWITGVSGETRVGIDYAEGERGYQLKSLGAPGFGFGFGRGKRPR
ncbi:hypothetical protein B0T24DRAFT_710709 [Lasiosphaeria ovina]|uniref:Uncharacterized protein n=1 Tax=Lasiosphaeria ovina TaxID=92902 RepID=A0AAE0N0F1_9PEZI|nr:hypothetical protein B0T24DRAFT_710709 [Lasiosphaeria ovina]